MNKHFVSSKLISCLSYSVLLQVYLINYSISLIAALSLQYDVVLLKRFNDVGSPRKQELRHNCQLKE